MNTNPRLGEPFALVLRAERERYNALFAQARRQHPALDGEAFGEFLATCVAPLVAAVTAARSDAVWEVGAVAYEIGLSLVGQGLAGPRARQPFINELWQRLLPAAADLVAAAPARVVGAACNALHYLGRSPDARPAQWIEEMGRFAGEAGGDVEAYLKLGQIAAWRAGLAHFRPGALEVADTLPTALALRALGAPEGADWTATRAALRADPWFVPGRADAGGRVAGKAGAFRGFGGLFTRPPTVASDGAQLFVRSGDGCWLLTADAFGATFHHAGAGEFDRARPAVLPGRLRLATDRRTVSLDGAPLALPLPGAVTSSATTTTTLALTTAHSHAVLLVALPIAGHAHR